MNPPRDDASITRRPDAEADLQDALHELVSSGEKPDAEALEALVARHPRHASDLTDFAVEWALQELLPEPTPKDDSPSAVPAAMERFKAKLAEVEAPKTSNPSEANEVPLALEPASDPFADRTPGELKQVATTLGLDKTLMAKLRDRKVVAETIPDELNFDLAQQLEVPPAAIIAHLSQPAVVYAGASFKAANKPEVGPKETFADAVRRSFMKPAEKDRWLAGAEDGAPDGAEEGTPDEDPSTETGS